MIENAVAVELTKRPMIVAQVHESGPVAWMASKFMSDGYQHVAPGHTEREAIENLATALMETLERYEVALREIAANKNGGPTCVTYASDALGSRFKNGERVVVGDGK